MALNYKNLHDPISKAELNGINTILRAVTEYKASISLNTQSGYGLFTVTDDTLCVTGGMATATYTINNDLIMVINEDGEGETSLTEILDNIIDLKVTFPPYYAYKVNPYTLTLVADHTSIYLDETVTITATLLEDEIAVEDASITLYQDGQIIDYESTDDSGVASFTVSNLTVGTHSFYCTCDLTDESNVIVVSVVEPVYDLVLSCSTPIIQASDSAIVTASLTRDGVAVSGETLTYTVKHGATAIDGGTVTTGSGGTATISYTGTGLGDVEFLVEFGILLQETYDLRDVHYYNDCTTNSVENYFNIPSAVSSASIYGFSSNGWKFGNASSYSRIISTETLNNWFAIEFTVNEISSNGLTHYIYSNGNTPNSYVTYNDNVATNRWTGGGQNNNTQISVGDRVRIEWRSGTMKTYLNNTLILDGTHSVSLPTQVEFHTGTNRFIRIKDLVIELL